jgi:hypothetical protein
LLACRRSPCSHVAIVSVATIVSIPTTVSVAGATLSLASVYASLFLSRVLPSPSVSRISLFLMEFKMDFSRLAAGSVATLLDFLR